MPAPVVAAAVVFIVNLAARLAPVAYSYVTGVSVAGFGAGVALLRPGVGAGRVLAFLSRMLPRNLRAYSFTAVMRGGARVPLGQNAHTAVMPYASRISHLEVEGGGLNAKVVLHITTSTRNSVEDLATTAAGVDELAALSRLVVSPVASSGSAMSEAQHVARQVWTVLDQFEKRGDLNPDFFRGVFGAAPNPIK